MEKYFEEIKKGSVFVPNIIIREFISEAMHRGMRIYAGEWYTNDEGVYGRDLMIGQ